MIRILGVLLIYKQRYVHARGPNNKSQFIKIQKLYESCIHYYLLWKKWFFAKAWQLLLEPDIDQTGPSDLTDSWAAPGPAVLGQHTKIKQAAIFWKLRSTHWDTSQPLTI